MTCKGTTKSGAPCRAQAIDGDYCEWHIRQGRRGDVTEIRITSKELALGEIRRRKALSPRPRVWRMERKRHA